MTTHGTATLGQLVQIVNPVINAAATAADHQDLVVLAKALRGKDEELARNMGLVFVAMTTGQQLVLEDQHPGQSVQSSSILLKLGSVPVHETYGFSAKDHLYTRIVDGVSITTSGPGVNIHRLLEDKVERCIASDIQIHLLTKDSDADSIITELEDRHEITFAELWQVIAKQRNGQRGMLLTNGVPNICFVRSPEDDSGRADLFLMSARWQGGAWELGGYRLYPPQQVWKQGCHVLSR